jgi:hypothetical protein
VGGDGDGRIGGIGTVYKTPWAENRRKQEENKEENKGRFTDIMTVPELVPKWALN